MNISLTNNLSTDKLLAFIAQQQEEIIRQQEQIVHLQARITILENEITRLKKLNPRPEIKPNTKPTDTNGDDNENECQSDDNESDDDPVSSGSEPPEDRKSDVDKPNHHTKRQNTKPHKPPVTEETVIAPCSIPASSIRQGREPFYVQELEIHAKSICYWLEEWRTPEFAVFRQQP